MRARGDGRRARPARRAEPGAAARRAGEALAHARRSGARARARRSASTPRRCCARRATAPTRSRALLEAGAVAGPRDAKAARARSWRDADGLLKMSELAERLGRVGGHDQALPARGAARRRRRDRPHLAQHGLLPAGVRRADPPHQAPAGGALHAAAADQRCCSTSRARAGRACDARARSPSALARCPANVLDRLEEIGVLTPDPRGYDPDDVKIIEAIARFRAGGYDEATRLHGLRHAALPRGAAAAGRGGGARAARAPVGRGRRRRARSRSSRSGREPLRELIGAMHSKLLLAELERQR